MNDQGSRESNEKLTIENITISRMEGVRQGYGIETISPGINLIHGPNGIGKSRTALALQSLIWPKLATNRAALIGNLDVLGDTWNIELDLGKAAYQKNSAAMSSFVHGLPPDSHQGRYLLTLQDLLRIENKNFALEIQKEMSGGYDLERIRTGMKIPAADKRFRPSKSAKPLQEARENLHTLRRQEADLRAQEESLDHLKSEHQKAIEATNRIGELEAAQKYRNAGEELEAARLALHAFPTQLTKILGTEYDHTVALTQRLDSLYDERRKCNITISNLRDEIQKTGFAEEIPPVALISGFRKRLETLQRQEADIQQFEREIAALSNQLTVLRNRLNQGLDDEQLHVLDESGLRKLAELNREWQNAQNTLHIQNELAQWLGSSNEWNRDSLRNGVELLSRYLRTANSDRFGGQQRLVVVFLIGAAIVIILAAVLLATSLSEFSLLLALAAAPLLWLAFTTKSNDADAERKLIQSQYTALELEAPGSWTPDDVYRLLLDLQKTAAQAELDHEREVRWGNLEEHRKRAELLVHATNEKRESLKNSLGINIAESVPESLELLAKSLDEWRRASDELAKVRSMSRAMISNRSDILSAFTEELQALGIRMHVHDAASVYAAIEHLDDRIDAANGASVALGHTLQRLEKDLSPRIEEAEGQLASMYSELELEHNDLQGLLALSKQVEPFGAAQNKYKNAEVAVTIAFSQLKQGDEHLDDEAIRIAMAEASGLAHRRDAVQAEMSRIETEIQQAQRQTRIEAEISNENAAIESLAEGREQDYSSAADRLVFELIQNRNREVNRPPVFRIANDLFVAFTNGAYSLGLDEDNAEFSAIDAENGQAVALDHLSSGTRVQLLLAVRLAFIEAAEQGIQLPLILDETLGNTDDIRAKAIIDATIEIAARGRQVFYFTAQLDEIGKWLSALHSLEDPPHWKVLDLASIRGKSPANINTDFTWDRSTFDNVDVPDDADHESLFDLLEIPAIDLRTATVSQVDLWYLVPDVADLIKLRTRSIRRWGQYLNLHRGRHLQGIWSESLHNKATARAKVIEELFNAWRIGRPAPLTANDLRNSNQISDSFWDEVVQCARNHRWDGAALIAALDRGEVSRFRRTTIEALSQWLSDNGLITDSIPLPDATIRGRVISSVNDAVENDVISIDEIDELLLRIAG